MTSDIYRSPGLVAQNLTLSRDTWSAKFTLEIETGSWTSLVGPSGAGKTTLLEIVAGFETPNGGSLCWNGSSLLSLRTHQRPIAYLFQQNALFPALTAQENLLLALHDAKISSTEKRIRVTDIAKRVGMEPRLRHRPGELSGGELARMNLARALLRPTPLLLLDEPFAALDAPLRREMNGLVRELHAERGLTILCVTHHPEEALLFADKVLVFSEGRVVANGTPAELVQHPPNLATARILDVGFLIPCDIGTHYVQVEQFTCNVNKSQTFAEPRSFSLTQWKTAQSAQGPTLVCLETGRTFPVDSPAEFNGTLYYDAKMAKIFPKGRTVRE